MNYEALYHYAEPSQSAYMTELRLRLDVEPMAKPRMTRRDQWAKRPVVQRYNAWKDQVNLLRPPWLRDHRYGVPWRIVLFAFFSIPPSISKTRAPLMRGQLKRGSRGDADNVLKAVMDTLWKEDRDIPDARCVMLWAHDIPHLELILWYGQCPLYDPTLRLV